MMTTWNPFGQITDMQNHLKQIQQLLEFSLSPYQIGFIQGHSYLKNKQVLSLKQLLISDDMQRCMSVVEEYEHRLAALIGAGYGISFAAARMAFYFLMKRLSIRKAD